MAVRTRKAAKSKSVSREGWRASWKGDLQFGLVRFGVEGVNARSHSGSDVQFNLLHEKCHSRIEYRKFCPKHGEVDQSEIVKGYEYGRGKYVEIDADELDEIRTKEERTLRIDEFIAADDLERIYLDGRVYYLTPTTARDHEPYHLLRRALEEEEKVGVGQVVFSGKEQLTAVAPFGSVLTMLLLNYDAELRDPGMLSVGEEPRRTDNLRLARNLIESMTNDDFSIATYTDRYRERVLKLIEAKRKGKSIEIPEEEEEEPIINLMDALKRSLSSSSKSRAPRAARRTTRRKSRKRVS
ncbi:MAG TPA: Ku protein [Planctomycetia bacterium]|nr:Ku protein [Planctomycetia bacterium]